MNRNTRFVVALFLVIVFGCSDDSDSKSDQMNTNNDDASVESSDNPGASGGHDSDNSNDPESDIDDKESTTDDDTGGDSDNDSDSDTDTDSDSDTDSDTDSDSDTDTDSDTDSESNDDDFTEEEDHSNSSIDDDKDTHLDIATNSENDSATNQASHTDTALETTISTDSMLSTNGSTDSTTMETVDTDSDKLEDTHIIEDVAYVFSSFIDDGEHGLHLIASYDGFDWAAIRNYTSVYQQGSELMRDPSVAYGPDGQFHMVWTTGWWEQNIAIAHSSNLIEWDEEILYVWADYGGPGDEVSDGSAWPGDTLNTPVPENQYVRNSWAPEIFYDDTTKEYVIYWSTSIDSQDVFPSTWNARSDNLNHRIYFITTKDFITYSPRRLLYAPADRVVIDAFICKLGPDDYRMVIKDEANSGYGNLHICTSTQPLISWATMPDDFWSEMSPSPFAGENTAPDFAAAEGPGGIEIDGVWYLYADYWMNGQTQTWRANDFIDITGSNAFDFPFHLRHGTIFESPKAVVDTLMGL